MFGIRCLSVPLLLMLLLVMVWHVGVSSSAASASQDVSVLLTNQTSSMSTSQFQRRNTSSRVASFPFLHPKPEDVQVGCQLLTSKRYISDGFCRSARAVTERVCSGPCLPPGALPWYSEYLKVWSRSKLTDWQCVERRRRTRLVTLVCDNGETRRYPVPLVAGCRCKRVVRQHNRSQASDADVGFRRFSTGRVASGRPRRRHRYYDLRRWRRRRLRGGASRTRWNALVDSGSL